MAISLTPATTNFGSVSVGTTSAGKIITVSNVSTGVVSFTGFTIAGLNPGDFKIAANSCGSSLAAGASCQVTVQFQPTVTGTRKATLKVSDSGAGTASQTAALTGSGV